jgi:hypothetical protein
MLLEVVSDQSLTNGSENRPDAVEANQIEFGGPKFDCEGVDCFFQVIRGFPFN